MPSIDEMYADLEAADSSGDIELAQAIASRIKQAQSAPKRPLGQPVMRGGYSPAIPSPGEAALGAAGQAVKDIGAGLLRGAGSIGATIVAPGDMLVDAVKSDRQGAPSRNEQRRAGIDAGLASLVGANPESIQYGMGKIGGEIAGTAGVGGILGNAIGRAVPAVAPLAQAVTTGGFRAGGMTGPAGILTRAAGGAITGGASAGLVDPSQASMGAAIGGALPVVAPAAGYAARKVGNFAGEAFGLSTGVGGESVKQAARAGLEGGSRAKSFTANMRGDAPMSDALDIAKSNLDAMRAAKNAQYRSGMVDITKDKAAIDFADVDSALSDAANVTLYKGQVKNAKAESVRAEVAKAVEEWKSLDPSEYHTPEGFDALKQRIGAIVESIPMEERTAGKVGKDIYNAVKGAITKQAPTYAKVMQDYSQAADDIAQAEKALSLGKKASVDTAMRKLQSLTRNNVNTNYGNRLAIAEQLQQEGGQDFMPALAGQSLNSMMPRGLSGLVASGAGAAGYIGAGIPGVAAALPVLAAQSPRLVGEAAYGAGQAARAGGLLTDLLMQSRAAPVSTIGVLDYIENRRNKK